MDTAFGVASFGVALGSLFVAIAVLPHIDVRRNWVKWAGVVFFLTGGVMYGEVAYYALFREHHPVSGWITANLLVQAVAVWSFVLGLYMEFVSDRLLSPPDRETLHDVAEGVKRLERGAKESQARADAAYESGEAPGSAADAGMMSGSDDDGEEEGA